MSEQEMEAPSALFRHCVTVFDEMSAQAKIVEAEQTAMMVYEGKLVELVTATCGLSVPYYTKVTQALKAMRCAKQLRRGGGSSGSQWELITAPTETLFDEYIDAVSGIEELPEYATAQQFRDMNLRIQKIERAIGL